MFCQKGAPQIYYYYYCSTFFFWPGEGLLHVRLFWNKVSSCPMRCFSFLLRGILLLKNKMTRMFHRILASRTEPLDAQIYLIQDYT